MGQEFHWVCANGKSIKGVARSALTINGNLIDIKNKN